MSTTRKTGSIRCRLIFTKIHGKPTALAVGVSEKLITMQIGLKNTSNHRSVQTVDKVAL